MLAPRRMACAPTGRVARRASAQVAELTLLLGIPRYFVYLAFASWLGVFVAMPCTLLASPKPLGAST